MAVAIDASAPAYVGTVAAATFAITTASFTPPNNSLLIAITNTEQAAGVGAAPTITNSGAALTWNTIATENVQSDLTSAAWAFLPTSRALTVTSTQNGTTHIGMGLQVFVITGSDQVSPIANAGVGNSNGGIVQATYTPTRIGSVGFIANTDFAHSSTGTLLANTTQSLEDFTLSGQNYFSAFETVPTVSLASLTFGYSTAVATSLNNFVYFEVLPPAVGGAKSPFGAALAPLRPLAQAL